MVFGRIGRLVDSHPSLAAIGFVALTFFKKIFSQVFTVFFFLYNFLAGFHLICSSYLRLMQRFNINSSLFIVIHFILWIGGGVFPSTLNFVDYVSVKYNFSAITLCFGILNWIYIEIEICWRTIGMQFGEEIKENKNLGEFALFWNAIKAVHS